LSRVEADTISPTTRRLTSCEHGLHWIAIGKRCLTKLVRQLHQVIL
jgi:hypothetical protein